MADEPINLRRRRRRKQREAADRRAEANRAWHGATRAEREALRRERERASRELDGRRRGPADRDPSGDGGG